MSTTISNGQTLFDPAEVRRGLEQFMEAGQVVEVRILDATVNGDRFPTTYAGFFDDPDKAVSALAPVKTAVGFYYTINPVDDRLKARAYNRLKKAGKGDSTSDKDIIRRRFLLIDCDVVRPAGISATEEEHAAALTRAKTIQDELHFNYGWADPVLCDSGNGAHLNYLIDEPADDGGIVENCLKALDAKYSDSVVKVDTKCFNPARISKLYGTVAGKGDSIPDRPHRISRVLNAPETLHVVRNEQLKSLAAEAAVEQKSPLRHSTHDGDAFDIVGFIQRNGLEVSGPDPYQGGQKWTLNHSPMCEHHGDGPYLIQFASGALAAGCHHDSCGWAWKDLRTRLEPKQQRQFGTSGDSSIPHEPTRQDIDVVKFGDLFIRHPRLHPVVIDGLLREGETCNLISNPKRGKSWTVYGMALSLICGLDWLGRFKTTPGRVLIVDNELHACTLAHRIPVVAGEMGLVPADYANELDIVSLRGNLQSLFDMETWFETVPPGTYKLIIFDAMYRFCIDGVSENDNAAMAGFYNRLDKIAAMTRAAIVLVHHASKGSQGEKRVTDVGSGAGAQSRAADCHLVLREHEEDDTVVLDAAVRSFPPVEPVALRWHFPLWYADSTVDAGKLKGRLSARQEQQSRDDAEGLSRTETALKRDPAGFNEVCRRTGFGKDRQRRLLNKLCSLGKVQFSEIDPEGKKCHQYQLAKVVD